MRPQNGKFWPRIPDTIKKCPPGPSSGGHFEYTNDKPERLLLDGYNGACALQLLLEFVSAVPLEPECAPRYRYLKESPAPVTVMYFEFL